MLTAAALDCAHVPTEEMTFILFFGINPRLHYCCCAGEILYFE